MVVMVAYQLRQKLNIRNSSRRSPGVHLSGVLREIALATGELDKKYGDQDLDELIADTAPEEVADVDALMRVILGYAWEDWLGPRIENAIYHPGEFFLDDIYATPDAIGFDSEGNYLLHEIKGTAKSSRKDITTVKLWIWQAMGYLKMMSERYKERCTKVVFHPLHYKGDYRGGGPEYCPTLIEFEWEEIVSNWNMILVNKHLAKPEGGRAGA